MSNLMDELDGRLPERGTKFRTKAKLEADTGGFLVKDSYVLDRTPNIEVSYYGFVPGAGGDVWWMEHEDGLIQAYCFTELEKIA